MHRILFFFYIFIASLPIFGTEYYSLNRITYSQGLSENTVNCIAQDSLGYIWVGTREGLNRYDGYACKSYYASMTDLNSLRSGYIDKIFVDHHSKIWIQGSKGLDCYLPETDSFEKVKITVNGERLGRIRDVYEQSGIKWLATADQGLVGVKSETDEVVYHSDEYKKIGFFCAKNDSLLWLICGNSMTLFNTKEKSFCDIATLPFETGISSVCYYSGLIWLSTSKGLWIYNEETSEFLSITDYAKKYHNSASTSLSSIAGYLITSMVTMDGRLWLSTDGGGILIIDTTKGFHVDKLVVGKLRRSLPTNAIRILYPDREGNMWIGTVHNGLNLIPGKKKKFRSLEHEDGSLNFPNGNVSNFLEDKNGALWASTFDGLCLMDQESMAVKKVVANGAVINVIAQDHDGIIYLGTHNKGLLQYHPGTGKINNFNFPPFNFDQYYIGALMCDRAGNIWIGTSDLYHYNKEQRTIQKIEGLNARGITCLLEDRKGNIWVGTSGGLNTILTESGRVNHYGFNNEHPFQISHGAVNCLFEDQKGNIWVGTNGGGLNCIPGGDQKVIFYDQPKNLLSNVVHGITGDSAGNIWQTTNGGLVRLDPETGETNVYDYTDGLVNNQFIDESIFLSQTGEILCGGEKGMDYFYPDRIHDNTIAPKVIVNGYFVDNQPVVAGNEKGGYERRIASNDTLTFRYDQSYFSFHFTGIEYSNPEKIQYAYQLEGFDNSWTYVKDRRIVNYSNIPPGDYTFKVKAANSDGYWSKMPTKINVVVKPPFSKTPLAYLLYLIGLGLILYVTYRYLLERKLLQGRLQFESSERKRIEELNQLKLRVFTHISHEFRTPLTLIISPVQELLKRFSRADENRHDLELIHNNARKLQVLVNQVLEIRKIESGSIQLNATNVDMVSFAGSCCESFHHWVSQKQIDLSFSSDVDSIVLSIDQSLMEKVIYNLLSNAIKYTPKGGTIKLNLCLDAKFCVIKVVDSGVGISPDHQEKLFEMFYQVPEKGESGEEGSGIGLALCKELVEAHKGHIGVDSKPGKGSCFTVAIPLPEKELLPDDETSEIDIELQEEDISEELSTTSILLVEDNDELRAFLADKLSDYFQVTQARNGVEALQIAGELQPQLVISDVMMPEMDGWELCAQLKSDIRISHIPVILLTALSDTENTIKGLDLGADAYLPKPFNLDHVVSQVNSLLENRKKQKRSFNQDAIESIENSFLTSVDKAFLEKVKRNVQENISNPNFSVQMLSDLMAMSRVNLHVKLKALCELSPSEFIMRIRLKKALELLNTKEYRMNEIADMIGFSTASHFSRNFKKLYGGTPSDFLNGKLEIQKS